MTGEEMPGPPPVYCRPACAEYEPGHAEDEKSRGFASASGDQRSKRGGPHASAPAVLHRGLTYRVTDQSAQRREDLARRQALSELASQAVADGGWGEVLAAGNRGQAARGHHGNGCQA